MKLNQTQRNYIAEQITKQLGNSLTKAGKKLTPPLFTEIGYGIDTSSIFNVDVNTPWNSKELQIKVELNNSVTWASENVCESKKDIQESILEKCGELPVGWYKSEWEAGNYTIEVDFPDCISSTNNNAPRIKAIWPGYDKAMKKARIGYPKRITTAIQQAVEAHQTMNELIVDSEKFRKKSQRKAMLADVANAETLLDVLSAQAFEIFN